MKLRNIGDISRPSANTAEPSVPRSEMWMWQRFALTLVELGHEGQALAVLIGDLLGVPFL